MAWGSTRADRVAALEETSARPNAKRPRFRDPGCIEQTAFISDPSRLKLAFCTRRAGKSFSIGEDFLEECWDTPSISCLYLALTRDSAKAIMWRDVLLRLNHELQLGAKANNTTLSLEFPNQSNIRLLGMDSDDSEKRKLLGGKYKKVAIDEAAAFRTDLSGLVYGVLKPAVADLRGTIELLSTPSDLHTGLFYELTAGQDPMVPGRWSSGGWSCHRWSWEQNPHVRPQMQEEIAELLAANPRVEETPIFQRNYRGRWVIDTSRLVYRYLPGRNDYDGALPTFRAGAWHRVLGVDLGWKDPSSFTRGAYHDHCRDLFIEKSWKRSGMDVTDVANAIRAELEAFPDIEAVVIDNANKQAVEEIQRRHNIPLIAADKAGKPDFVDIMNSELIQGRIRLGPDCDPLREEYAGLIWDERKLPRRFEHPSCANHCFVAGTLVETSSGQRPIEAVAIGDLVMTRAGWRRVTQSTTTGIAPTWRLTTEAGRTLVGTPTHPVWSGGWKDLALLIPGDTLTAWESTGQASDWCTTGSLIGGTRNRTGENCASTSSRSLVRDCTASSGRRLTAQFLRNITSTIWTAIRSTIESTISVPSLRATTFASTPASPIALLSPVSLFSPPSRRHRRGIALRPGSLGTERMGTPLGGTLPQHLARASSVVARFCRRWLRPRFVDGTVAPARDAVAGSMTSSSSVPSVASGSCGIDTRSPAAVLDRVLRVEPTGEFTEVFDLSVEGAHEFFANGLLVSNCADGTLYLWRFCYQYLSEGLAKLPPKPGTADWALAQTQNQQAEIEAYLERELERNQREQSGMDDRAEDWL